MARRVVWTLTPLLLTCLVAGCLLPEGERDDGAAPRLRPEYGPDAVIMQIAVIERELNDPLLNDQIWQRTDQLVVSPDRRALLEENGLRVGQVVGPTAAELQNLLLSERWCKPSLRVVPSGQKIRVPKHDLGVVHEQCQYDVYLGREPQGVQADQARFCFDVTPTHTADGGTRLEFVPKVETGEQVLPFQPVPEKSSWVYRVERPAKAYPELGWEVTLRPNEYLIVGAQRGRENTIGHRAFVQEEGEGRVQRLLVIRTTRSPKGSDLDATLAEIARSQASPPLAVQATMGAIRASRP